MRLPPALNVALLTTLSLLAGCLEPVEAGGDPDLDAAAQEAAETLDLLTDESGHIAGTVVGDDGLALAGVRVELDGAQAVDSDEQGRFAFVDVSPGEHLLAAHKEGYVDAAGVSVPVAAQSIARPSLVLAKVVPPAYFETTSFVFYSEAAAFGLDLGCVCYGNVVLAEGATEALLEVTRDRSHPLPMSDFAFDAYTYAEDEVNGTEVNDYFGGYVSEYSPAFIPGDVLDGADFMDLHVAPDLGVSELYTVYLTVFYNGAAPEGFTAVVEG